MPVPYTFATATTAIPLSQLDNNFATAITLGNTAIQLGNTVTTLNNMTLANVTISSGTVSITNVAVTTANVSGTANISTLVVVGNSTMGGNVSVGGNVSISVNTSVSGNASVTGNVSAAGITASSDLTLSGGTANGVLYLNGSKVATSGSALTFDGTSLSVGTSSHPSTLAVYAATGGSTTGLTVNASGNMLNLFGSSSTNAGVIFDATDGTVGSATGVPMIYRLGGSEAMRLTSTSLYTASGINVGFGTSSPNGKVTIGYSSALIDPLIFNNTATNGRQWRIGDGSGTVAGNFGFYDATAAATRLIIDSSGNLGLGVTPSAWTSTWRSNQVLNGAVSANNSQVYLTYNAYYNSGWKYIANGVATSYLQDNDGSHIWYKASSGTAGDAITFTQAATLTADGDYLVGQTSAGLTDAKSVTLSKQYGVVYVNHLTGQTSGDQYAIFGYAGGSIGSITQNGTTAVAYNTTSDYRLKDNQQPLTGSGEFIDALQPKTWNWKADGSRGVGFIAHEIQAVSPGSVVGTKDAVDEEGKPIYQAMEYGSAEFIANIIAELQSLRARVAQLESN